MLPATRTSPIEKGKADKTESLSLSLSLI